MKIKFEIDFEMKTLFFQCCCLPSCSTLWKIHFLVTIAICYVLVVGQRQCKDLFSAGVMAVLTSADQ